MNCKAHVSIKRSGYTSGDCSWERHYQNTRRYEGRYIPRNSNYWTSMSTDWNIRYCKVSWRNRVQVHEQRWGTRIQEILSIIEISAKRRPKRLLFLESRKRSWTLDVEKTCLKQLSKTLPQNEALATAIAEDDKEADIKEYIQDQIRNQANRESTGSIASLLNADKPAPAEETIETE